MNATLTIMSKITACLQFLPDPVGAREDVLLGAPAASFQVQISGLKMKPELLKIFNLFEELEVAGETVSLTILSKGGKSITKLQLESPSSPSSTTTPTSPRPTACEAPARRRRHRGARARAQRRQRAADHQGTTLADVSPPAPGEASAPAGPHHDHLPQRRPLFPIFLPSPSPSTGRRRVMSLARLPLPSFASLNIDGHPPSPPPPPPPPCTHVTSTSLRAKAAPLDGRKCCGVATMAESMYPMINVVHEERKVSLSRSWCSCSTPSSRSLHHVCSPSGSSASSSKDWENDSEIDSDECFE